MIRAGFLSGCWTHQQECQADRCVLVTAAPSSVQDASYRFCCCSHDLCNANYTEAPPTADTPALSPMRTDGRDERTGDDKSSNVPGTSQKRCT